MSGLSEIVDKILKDARSKANSTSEEASTKAREIISVAKNEADIYYSRHMNESYVEREAIIERGIAAAKLESRKLILQTKQDILSDCFKQALHEVKKDKKRYKALIASMISIAEDDDEVVLSSEDKETITPQFIQEEWKKLGKKKPPKVTYDSIAGGVILRGTKTDKNMSLEVALASIRDEIETEIVSMLFQE